ncbi:MAG: hypothetical protein IJZ30_05800 [Alphaproteobacteria bacterium]|nr:hypothetical protein [Alphaproteobacteria bacterium]
MKINLILITILVITLNLCYNLQKQIQEIRNKVTLYKKNEQLLSSKIKELHHEKIKLETIKEELLSETKKDTFNWHADISNTHVIKRLQKN